EGGRVLQDSLSLRKRDGSCTKHGESGMRSTVVCYRRAAVRNMLQRQIPNNPLSFIVLRTFLLTNSSSGTTRPNRSHCADEKRAMRIGASPTDIPRLKRQDGTIRMLRVSWPLLDCCR